MIVRFGNIMKAFCLTIVLFTSFLNIVGAAEPISGSKSVSVLVERVRTAIPQGWTVTYDMKDSWLEISRDKKALASVYVINGPGHQEQKPERIKVTLAFRVVDFITPENYSKISAKNMIIEKSLSVQYKELEKKQISHKFDSFSPTTEEDKVAVARYEALKNTLHSLPDFYFRDISLTWEIGSPSSYGPAIDITDVKIRDEYTQVQKKVLGLLSTYEKVEP